MSIMNSSMETAADTFIEHLYTYIIYMHPLLPIAIAMGIFIFIHMNVLYRWYLFHACRND